MSRSHFWRSARFKLLLLSLTLLGIPWAGYRFIQETERFLRDAQDQALQYTASSVANVMQGYEDSFHGVARSGSVLTFRNLFLHTLQVAPQLDGYRDEWIHYQNNFSRLQSVDDKLQADILLGRYGRYLYLLLGVKDPHSDFGEQGDAVDLALTDGSGTLRRYRIQPYAPGWVAARRLRSADEAADTPVNEPAIRGEWQNDANGYTLELRLPRDLLQDRLSLRFFDGHSRQALASGQMSPADALGLIVERSAILERALVPVAPPATRIWVTDHQGLVLASTGRLAADAPLSAEQSAMPWFVKKLILAVLPGEADTVADLPDDQTQLFVRPVVDALSGQPTSLRRQPRAGDAVVVSAAVPIRGSEGVKGAVLVEQTTSAVLSIQDLALQRLFGLTLLFVTVAGIGLLSFAGRLVSRIVQLNNKVEAMASRDEQLLAPLDFDGPRDEIGDLGRSFASAAGRLNDDRRCLGRMVARLAQEMRGPLTVVRGALDPAGQAPGNARSADLEQARRAAHRLDQILIRLRATTRLEQALHQAEPTDFDLATRLRLQIEELRKVHRGIDIDLRGTDKPVWINGIADLIVQTVAGLVDNAVDLHRPGSRISILCAVRPDSVQLSVFHAGPPLPADILDLPSRTSECAGRDDEPPAGLELQLARRITQLHGGALSVTNHNDPAGVLVSMTLPRLD
jgi:two-component system sensor histidine kinase ChvG